MNHLCGIRLSTVTIVVGWLNLIASLFTTVLLCVAFAYLDDVVKAVEDHINDTTNEMGVRTAVIIALTVYFTTSVANVIASSLLIVGTIKERHLLLAPWLINAYIFIFFNVINFIYMIYVAIAQGLPVDSTIVAVITTGVGLVIQCTIWSAIYSHFKQLRANRDLQQRLLPTSSGPSYTNYTKMPPTVE